MKTLILIGIVILIVTALYGTYDMLKQINKLPDDKN